MAYQLCPSWIPFSLSAGTSWKLYNFVFKGQPQGGKISLNCWEGKKNVRVMAVDVRLKSVYFLHASQHTQTQNQGFDHVIMSAILVFFFTAFLPWTSSVFYTSWIGPPANTKTNLWHWSPKEWKSIHLTITIIWWVNHNRLFCSMCYVASHDLQPQWVGLHSSSNCTIVWLWIQTWANPTWGWIDIAC